VRLRLPRLRFVFALPSLVMSTVHLSSALAARAASWLMGKMGQLQALGCLRWRRRGRSAKHEAGSP
jgi:hypothetical protein